MSYRDRMGLIKLQVIFVMEYYSLYRSVWIIAIVSIPKAPSLHNKYEHIEPLGYLV